MQRSAVIRAVDFGNRQLQDLITITVDLRKRGIGFKSLRENLDTTTPGGRLVFHVFAALAEFIRELIIENTRDGVAAAKARGQQLGRPKVMTDEQVNHAIALLSQPKASAKSIAKLLGVSRSTLYAYVPQLAAIRAAAAKQAAVEVPAQRTALTREPEAWWQLAEFTLDHSSTNGWQLTHRLYPANPGHPIPVENYPTGSGRLRRNILAAQAAAAEAIEDLTEHRVLDWETDEDGAGEPCWEAFLDIPVQEPVSA